MKKPAFITENPWQQLRSFTDARIGLGRAGVSLPTEQLLAFQLSHAQARDAVHFPLDLDAFEGVFVDAGFDAPIRLHSQAEDRMTYLQRPDLGRLLNEDSAERLRQCFDSPAPSFDLALVIVDGLSSTAVARNTLPFITALCEQLDSSKYDWTLAPLAVVEQGRVAIGDEVGELLNASIVLVLVGERPGLSSPDSLGLYMTWGPRKGLSDAMRNCISNVRPAGLKPEDAARKAFYLLDESRQRKLSGVKLKDRSQDDVLEHDSTSRSFLIRPLEDKSEKQ
ncbi:ethanolamine ammonia-lyase subunit EutC [Alteromonas confluentis]|uniref:Ethanolamine ammonia-lyase small subunit n=1 Tax=Alteromonas confluentis TaxID=1656094 RepID=A0A1E7Z7A4_9ALTE|nr:ethanolamine ammonia-lyase subunit EutC [Alteromonas confluentis]OFC69390.1 ethanolamine ammonia-lyase [Alteromonas confluentis]